MKEDQSQGLNHPDVYKIDHFVEVTEDVLETIRAAERAEAAYDRRMYRYKAHYSLDCDNGIENAILLKPQTPEMLLEEKQLREQLYAAVMALPEKQAKRIYARYYLGMSVSEIAAAEDVDPSRVRDSIRRGLKQLAKYFQDRITKGARSQSASGTGSCALSVTTVLMCISQRTLYFIGRVKKNVVPPPEVSENPIFPESIFANSFAIHKFPTKMSFIRARFISTVETIKDKRFIFSAIPHP